MPWGTLKWGVGTHSSLYLVQILLTPYSLLQVRVRIKVRVRVKVRP